MEYLSHLIRFLSEQRDAGEWHFVVHPEFERHAPELIDEAEDGMNHVWIHTISEQSYRTLASSGRFTRAFVSWDVVEQYSRRLNVDHCMVMAINFLEPVLGLPRAKRVSFEISGILFFPYVRIQAVNAGISKKVKTKLERCRKYLQTNWILRNPKVRTLFVLNDPTAAQSLNEAHVTESFLALPDPVPQRKVKRERARSPLTATESRLRALMFGSLRENKGVRELFEAMHLLSDAEAGKLALFIIGQADETLCDEIDDLVAELRDAQPRLYVQYEDRFMSYAELDQALDDCDVVIAPYQRTEGSSGVIGHAASHELPVIGPDSGLIGSLVREYDLGETVNASDPRAIAKAIRRVVDDPSRLGSSEGMRRYVAERSAKEFASCIVEAVTGTSAPHTDR